MQSVIYIASDVRSGSTLLDNLLSNHPDVASVGELRHLSSHTNKTGVGEAWDWVCTCGYEIKECDTWREVWDLYEERHERPFLDTDTYADVEYRRIWFHPVILLSLFSPIRSISRKLKDLGFNNGRLEEIGKECFRIYSAFSDAMGVNNVVDSSKIAEQLQAILVAQQNEVDVKLIHIVRDGRAVVYSKLQRAEQYNQKNFSVLSAITGWVVNNMQIQALYPAIDEENVVRLHYEDLCNHTQSTMEHLCDFLEISFNANMLQLSRDNKHNIAGSPHRFSWDNETEIQLDERWRENLTFPYRLLYFLLAGIYHKCIGY